MNLKPPIFLAIDTTDFDVATTWVQATQDHVAGFKLGLEFFSTFGLSGVKRVTEFTDLDIFLDMKLHDIPNTVAGAVRSLKLVRPRFLTVHASGGRAMVAAAVKEAPEIEIAAVTVLTSLAQGDLTEIGFESPPLESAVKLAKLAVTAGARAIVCSPLEIMAVRNAIGPDITIITPGVRPLAAELQDDQQRTMDPRGALVAGATYLVIGRPITSAWSQGADALRDRAAEISSQLNL